MKLIVFLGPSLPWAEARKLAPGARLCAPARQGDVWRALQKRPRAIALIDGVFEAQPSVWHHELLDALDAGVAVFGAASMGALRAAELASFGMIGIGRIYRWLQEGVIQDDAEVALLHAGREQAFRALTLPLVNVRAAALEAQRQRLLTPLLARRLIESAGRIFYQERSWPAVLAQQKWPAPVRAKWGKLALPDPKAEDARACLIEAARFAASSAQLPVAPRVPEESSLVRRRRISAEIATLQRRADLQGLADAGLRRALLAGWARSLGLEPRPSDLAAARLRVRGGLAADVAERLAEDLALERLMLDQAERILPDGPGRGEALVAQSRLSRQR